MGCMPSRYVDIYSKDKQINSWKPYFDTLCLNEYDVGKFYRIFRRVDVDGSGNIELAELLVHLDVDKTPFTKRVFSIFDEDGSGEIDFREFVLSLWNYCTLSRSTLVLFAFDLYDRDSSGEISCSEVKKMLDDVYGLKVAEKNPHAKAIAAKLQEMEESDGDIDVEKFRVFVRNHPALLFPAFHMQETIQKHALGVEYWKFHSEKRMKLCDGKYMSIGQFMETHLNKNMRNVVTAISVTEQSKSKVGEAPRALKLLGSTGTHAHRRSGGVYPLNDRLGSDGSNITTDSNSIGRNAEDDDDGQRQPSMNMIPQVAPIPAIPASGKRKISISQKGAEVAHSGTTAPTASVIVNTMYNSSEAEKNAKKYVSDSKTLTSKLVQEEKKAILEERQIERPGDIFNQSAAAVVKRGSGRTGRRGSA